MNRNRGSLWRDPHLTPGGFLTHGQHSPAPAQPFPSSLPAASMPVQPVSVGDLVPFLLILYFESPLSALSAWFLILSPPQWDLDCVLRAGWILVERVFLFLFLTDSPNLCWPDSLPWDPGTTKYSAATGDFKDSRAHTALFPKHAPLLSLLPPTLHYYHHHPVPRSTFPQLLPLRL